MKERSLAELTSIRAAGGGLILNAEDWRTSDLVQIAAAGEGRSLFVVRGVAHLSQADLLAIAAAGQGSVVFTDGDD